MTRKTAAIILAGLTVAACTANPPPPAAAPAVPPPATPVAPSAPSAGTPRVAADGLGLPLLPGHDLTVQKCTNCHSADDFISQRHNEDQWGQIVQDMIGNGADISDSDAKQIAKYLAAALPPR